MEVDQFADVHRQEETGQIGRFREEIALQPREVCPRSVEIAAQVLRLAEQVQGVLHRVALAHLFGERQGDGPVLQGVLAAFGLDVREAEVEAVTALHRRPM